MQTTKITFEVNSFRKIASPYEDRGINTYMAVLNVKDVPEVFDDWRSINVRDPKLTSGVATKIKSSLIDQPEQFFFKNRGMTMVVKEVSFDNKLNTVSVELEDPKKHGLLDGGHTFKVIRTHINELTEEEIVQVGAFVKIEFIQGMEDLEEVVNVVEARNTSNQVKVQSIEELKGSYEEIKKIVSGKTYSNRIAYKEYELDNEGEKKDIDIKEILSYLVCFDVDSFNGDKHPVIAYSSKGAVVDHFKENDQNMRKYIKILPKVLELRDHIYATLPEAYNSTGGKFGALKDVAENKNDQTHQLNFSTLKSKYKIPSAFIYPALASFRALLKVTQDDVVWKDDPIRFLETIKTQLSQRLVEQAKGFNNPTKMGKNKDTWRACSDLVRIEVLERGL